MRYPWPVAHEIAKTLCAHLSRGCSRIIIAGSLRRRQPDVGDIEILYIPIVERVPNPATFFDEMEVNHADTILHQLLTDGILAKRKNVKGSEVYGEQNKLTMHVASGIPVDFFAASESNWFNYLVCRTGPADSNKAICNAAIARGWKWHPYGEGFTDEHGRLLRVTDERAAFDLVGLRYRDPEYRV